MLGRESWSQNPFARASEIAANPEIPEDSLRAEGLAVGCKVRAVEVPLRRDEELKGSDAFHCYLDVTVDVCVQVTVNV